MSAYSGNFIPYELQEEINKNGEIVKPISESAINPLLRKLFKIRPDFIYIHFSNAAINNVHEKSLMNILKGVGFENIRISSVNE